jgi:alkylation response protein AidB-like acyl-CoA dehydrogenase
MRFGLSEEQRMLCDAVSKALAKHVPLERVKSHAKGTAPASDDLWAAVVDAGIPSVLVPAEHGGLGLGLLEAALVAEMLGRYVAPVQFIGTAVLAPLALQLAGSKQQKSEWLGRLATGDARLGVAICEAAGTGRDGAEVRNSGNVLYGKSLFVLDSTGADAFVVADSEGGLHLVDATAPGVELIDVSTIDVTRFVAELRLAGVRSEPLCGGNASHAIRRMIEAAWVMFAADTLGAAQRMIELAVNYSAERVQFGRPIGTFQAVKHMCATMAAALEPCRALIWYAAYAQDQSFDDASLTAAHAKAQLAEVGRMVARTSVQVHGGIGITDELGLHFWFKRIGFGRQIYGGPEEVRRFAARLQGMLAV